VDAGKRSETAKPRISPRVRLRRRAARPGENRFEAIEYALVELNAEHAHRGVELLHRARPDDRRRHRGTTEQPSEGDVARRDADLHAEPLVRLETFAVLGDRALGVVARAATLRRLLQRTAENSAFERTPRNQAEPVRLARGDDLELDRSIDEV